jgi:NAD(P)-dependent dehydrogenase (short-subunit alcohol dehydrogenase family)
VTIVVTNADVEPGLSIARALEQSDARVSRVLEPNVEALVNVYRLDRCLCAPIEDLPFESFAETIETLVSELFFASQSAAAQMLAEGHGGVIVNVTSVAGVVALPGMAAFCSAMAAVNALTKVLAVEWAPHGVRVAAVAAGLSPELTTALREQRGSARRQADSMLLEPSAIAEVIRFVLSDAAHAVAGVPVYADGGWLSDGYWLAFP